MQRICTTINLVSSLNTFVSQKRKNVHINNHSLVLPPTTSQSWTTTDLCCLCNKSASSGCFLWMGTDNMEFYDWLLSVIIVVLSSSTLQKFPIFHSYFMLNGRFDCLSIPYSFISWWHLSCLHCGILCFNLQSNTPGVCTYFYGVLFPCSWVDTEK